MFIQGLAVALFFVGMMGDAFTTFLGILGGLGGVANNQSYLFAGIGTSVITGFNLLTTDLWERNLQITYPLWILAILFDFFTSWIGSQKFITASANSVVAQLLIMGITFFITASPAMLLYIIRNPLR